MKAGHAAGIHIDSPIYLCLFMRASLKQMCNHVPYCVVCVPYCGMCALQSRVGCKMSVCIILSATGCCVLHLGLACPQEAAVHKREAENSLTFQQ